MFALIAADAGIRPEEIVAMATALPRLGGVAPLIRLDVHGTYAAAVRPIPILPEDVFDAQPCIEPDLVFVGRARLDDRTCLLGQLEIAPEAGARLADSELLRRAYRKWREAAPQHLYGDFCFAAWERHTHRLIAATDHLGSFPLFYSCRGQRILLATQLAALLAYPEGRPALDVQSLGLAAAGHAGHNRTMFEGIRALAGGELLAFHDGRLRTRRWWRPQTSATVQARPVEYVEDVRERFEAAVVSRLRSRGAIVAAMSGGLDSSLVTASAANQLAARGGLLDAYTAVPACETGADYGASWAAAVARWHANIRHRLIGPGTLAPLDILPRVHSVSGCPAWDTAKMVWSWQISTLAAQDHAHVVLCGDHGNLSLSYPGDCCESKWSRAQRVAEMGRRALDGLRHPLIRLRSVRGLVGRGPQPERSGVQGAGADLLLPQFRTPPALREESSPRDKFIQAVTAPRSSLRIDHMAQFGVDWRDPTGDRRLLERILTFPLHAFRAGFRPRGLARELGRDLLPEGARLRITSGAGPDETTWFTRRPQDYRAAVRSIRHSRTCAQFIDLKQLECQIEVLCSGRGSREQAALTHHVLDAAMFAVEFEHGTLQSARG